MSSSEASELPAPERDLERKAHAHLDAGEHELAAWAFLIGARLALARGDFPRAADCNAAAVASLPDPTELAEPGLVPNLLLLQSELAAEKGQLETSAELSTRALAGFRALGDEEGVIATWMARAERAMRGGHAEAASAILDQLLPVLDARGDREPGLWLRVRLAAILPPDDEARAVELLARAFELTAPGSAARMAVAAEAMRRALDDGRPRDALAVGVTVLDAAAHGPRALHAEVLVLCAAALAEMGEAEEAARFASRAEGFDSPGLDDARRRLDEASRDDGG